MPSCTRSDKSAEGKTDSTSIKERTEEGLLPAKHDPQHKEPLPVEIIPPKEGASQTDADLEFPDGGLRAWWVLSFLRLSRLQSRS